MRGVWEQAEGEGERWGVSWTHQSAPRAQPPPQQSCGLQPHWVEEVWASCTYATSISVDWRRWRGRPEEVAGG